MKYKVGDRVKIKSLDWYNKNKDRIDEVVCSNTIFVPQMVEYCEKIVTISSVLSTLKVYRIKEDCGMFNWTDEMIEGLVEEETYDFLKTDKPYPSPEDRLDNIQFIVYDELKLPDGYVFKDENGNVINTQRIVLEKKGNGYPKTYDECCKELNIAVRDLDILDNMLDTTEIVYRKNLDRLLNSFRKLLICRDAYWKIAGEGMGLDKPWEPDWHNSEKKYTVEYYDGELIRDFSLHQNRTFSFPTPEVRDAFKENFKELIEQCKEFL